MGDDEVKDLVECHSGYEYAQRPTALHWEGERLEIKSVEADWRIPGGHCFRVRTRDDRLFELFYGELYDEWRINPGADTQEQGGSRVNPV